MSEPDRDNLIWIIDDEFDSYEIEREMLQKEGYDLVVTRSAAYRGD